MDRLVRVQGQLQPEQGFWIQGKKSNSGKVTVEPQTVDCPLSCPIGESLNILEYVDD